MSDLLERLKAALADRYAVESEIGRGGMAVVYLARDLRHDRRVAIKVLHPELTATLGGERFLKEIKTVAGLQHPHILPLYDSGEAEGLLYYVMPYAEGESLRHRLDRSGQLAVDESVRIAVEVADGLDYAHRQGVVHRDIKPANILLAEGHATIADFGLARAIEAARSDRVTSTGLGVGTPLYASPEQATAQETLDGRTDVYSLGCVLYEMLAGEPPITGATPKMIQARRLSETPTPLHSVRDTVSPALDHVIARALARVPADRYGTASEFGRALQTVLLTATPAPTPDLPATGAYRTSPLPGSRRPQVVLAVVLGCAVLVAGALWVAKGPLGRSPLQISVGAVTNVTSDVGVEYQPAISPDGGEVAYVRGHIGRSRIVVRSTAESGGGGGVEPAEQDGANQRGPTWTADGSAIRFCASSDGRCEWKEVGKLGGFVRAVRTPRMSSRIAWSRDGSRAAFAVQDSIFTYAADGGEPELLALHTVDPWGPHSFTWSPDGRWLAYVNGNPSWRLLPNTAPASIWIVDAEGGEPIRVTNEENLDVSPQWLPDSRHLLFVSDRGGARGVHLVEAGPDGPPGPAISVLPSSDPHSISISADGKKLAYSRYTIRQNIWVISLPASGSVSIREAEPVTSGNQIVESHDLSPDGQWIVFDSKRRGENDIFKQELSGGSQQLVGDLTGNVYGPVWSPDGSEIAFSDLGRETGGEVLVVPVAGGIPVGIANSPGWDGSPRWSPDGLSVTYESDWPQGRLLNKIWRVSRDSVGAPWGDPVQLTDFVCEWADWDPDGESLLCAESDGWTSVSRDGQVLARYEASAFGFRSLNLPHSSADGSQIYFVGSPEDGPRGVWAIPADGGNAALVVAFDDPSLTIHDFLTVGSGSLYLTIAEHDSDIRVVDLEW